MASKKKPGSSVSGTGNWSKNNVAAGFTFLSLQALLEIPDSAKFESTGTRNLRTLEFYVPGASTTANRDRASALARRLDRTFVKLLRAKYQKAGGTLAAKSKKARDAMEKTLMGALDTVASLAVTADEHYLFLGEKSPV